MANKNFSKWTQHGKSVFHPAEDVKIIDELPPGAYTIKIERSYSGDVIIVTKVKVEDKHLIALEQPEENYINNILDQFCSKKKQFAELKIAYKTGILLYGVPGGGKTSILVSVIRKVESLGGVCFLMKSVGDLYHFDDFYKTVYRKIEPDRLILNIFEDIDGMAGGESETVLVNILDGIGDCNNVINIATTNYTERLSDRVINRPGRFDRRIEIKSPSYENREKYLMMRLPEAFRRTIDLEMWVRETENFTLAQLNELVKSVLLLEEDFHETVDKIRDMCKIPRSHDYNKEMKPLGFFTSENTNGKTKR